MGRDVGHGVAQSWWRCLGGGAWRCCGGWELVIWGECGGVTPLFVMNLAGGGWMVEREVDGRLWLD